MRAYAVGAVLGLLFLLGVLLLVEPSPPLRRFQLILTDGRTFTGYGTEIRGVGFCTELVVRGIVTSRICQPHIVNEMYEQPAVKEPANKTIASN